MIEQANDQTYPCPIKCKPVTKDECREFCKYAEGAIACESAACKCPWFIYQGIEVGFIESEIEAGANVGWTYVVIYNVPEPIREDEMPLRTTFIGGPPAKMPVEDLTDASNSSSSFLKPLSPIAVQIKSVTKTIRKEKTDMNDHGQERTYPCGILAGKRVMRSECFGFSSEVLGNEKCEELECKCQWRICSKCVTQLPPKALLALGEKARLFKADMCFDHYQNPEMDRMHFIGSLALLKETCLEFFADQSAVPVQAVIEAAAEAIQKLSMPIVEPVEEIDQQIEEGVALTDALQNAEADSDSVEAQADETKDEIRGLATVNIPEVPAAVPIAEAVEPSLDRPATIIPGTPMAPGTAMVPVGQLSVSSIGPNKYFLAEDIEQASNELLKRGQVRTIEAVEIGGRLEIVKGIEVFEAAKALGVKDLRVKRVTFNSDNDQFLATAVANKDIFAPMELSNVLVKVMEKFGINSHQKLADNFEMQSMNQVVRFLKLQRLSPLYRKIMSESVPVSKRPTMEKALAVMELPKARQEQAAKEWIRKNAIVFSVKHQFWQGKKLHKPATVINPGLPDFLSAPESDLTKGIPSSQEQFKVIHQQPTVFNCPWFHFAIDEELCRSKNAFCNGSCQSPWFEVCTEADLPGSESYDNVICPLLDVSIDQACCESRNQSCNGRCGSVWAGGRQKANRASTAALMKPLKTMSNGKTVTGVSEEYFQSMAKEVLARDNSLEIALTIELWRTKHGKNSEKEIAKYFSKSKSWPWQRHQVLKLHADILRRFDPKLSEAQRPSFWALLCLAKVKNTDRQKILLKEIEAEKRSSGEVLGWLKARGELSVTAEHFAGEPITAPWVKLLILNWFPVMAELAEWLGIPITAQPEAVIQQETLPVPVEEVAAKEEKVAEPAVEPMGDPDEVSTNSVMISVEKDKVFQFAMVRPSSKAEYRQIAKMVYAQANPLCIAQVIDFWQKQCGQKDLIIAGYFNMTEAWPRQRTSILRIASSILSRFNPDRSPEQWPGYSDLVVLAGVKSKKLQVELFAQAEKAEKRGKELKKLLQDQGAFDAPADEEVVEQPPFKTACTDQSIAPAEQAISAAVAETATANGATRVSAVCYELLLEMLALRPMVHWSKLSQQDLAAILDSPARRDETLEVITGTVSRLESLMQKVKKIE